MVTSISYNKEREINGLSITGRRGCPVFIMKPGVCTASDTYNNGNNTDNPDVSNSKKQVLQEHSVSQAQMEKLKKELKRTGVKPEAVEERYHIDSIENIPEELYMRAMAALYRTETAAVV